MIDFLCNALAILFLILVCVVLILLIGAIVVSAVLVTWKRWKERG